MMLRQLHFSELDLVLHSRYTPAQGSTVFQSEEVKAVEARTTVLPPLPEDRSVTPSQLASTCPVHGPFPDSCLIRFLTHEARGGSVICIFKGQAGWCLRLSQNIRPCKDSCKASLACLNHNHKKSF